MANKNINWVSELVATINKVESEKVVSHIDDHANEIMAIKRLGLSWDQTADETNRILGLKGLDKVTGKKLARIASKWKLAGIFDLEKVEAINEQVRRSLEAIPPVAPPKQPMTAQPVAPVNQPFAKPGEVFATPKELAQAIVSRFPGLKHDAALVEKTFAANKEKDKEAVLKAYRDALAV